MKKLLIILILTTISGNLYSLTYTTAKLPDEKTVEIGASGGILTDGNFEGLLTVEYPWIDRLGSILKLGYKSETDYTNTKEKSLIRKGFYVGLENKILLAFRFGGTDYLSLTLGGHYCEVAGADVAIQLGNFFKNFDNYIGFDFDINFLKNNKITYPGAFVLGVKIKPFSPKTALLIEAGIPLTDYTKYQFGISFKYNL